MNRSPEIPAQVSFAQLPATSTRDALRVEYQWLAAKHPDAPVAVFLHEGLGSIAMWRDWPQSLCDALGLRGLVYSRPGYGRSTPRAAGDKWSVDFMHRQAGEVLPALLDALGIDAAERRRMWLIGHSDGGSIALLYAAAFPEALAGAVVLAPHVTVEPGSVEAIAATRHAYRTPTCATSFRAITRTSIRRSSAGTTSGSIPRSARGTSRMRSRRSSVRCSRSRVGTTNTRRWRKSM